MRVLIVHNRYRSAQPSGENSVVDEETVLLRERGVEVHQLFAHSDQIEAWPAGRRALLPARVVWSRKGERKVRDAIARSGADVVHVHNTFPLFSPAALRAAHGTGARVVKTLHNFRPLCPAATFFRDGHVCEECLGRRVALPALAHGCYRGSRTATAPLVAMDAVHSGLGTWSNSVDAFITPSAFARSKYIEAGWPDRLLTVKYNTAADPGVRRQGPGEGFACLTRLYPEKGIDVLLRAWGLAFPDGGQRLRIVGSGELDHELRELAAQLGLRGVEFCGQLPRDQALDIAAGARALILPSLWYEVFPRAVVEAYAMGVPVIASQLGGLGEVVEDEITGLHFEPGSADSLAQALVAMASSDELSSRLGIGALTAYTDRYSPAATTDRLIDIYRRVLDSRPLPASPGQKPNPDVLETSR